MPPVFLRRFARLVKCYACKRLAAKGHKSCSVHLEKAKLWWRARCAERKARGQCIGCPKKAVAGELRCRTCKGRNRLRCLIWGKAHVEERAEYARHRKEERLKAGLCTRCGIVSPRAPGFTRCQPCADAL